MTRDSRGQLLRSFASGESSRITLANWVWRKPEMYEIIEYARDNGYAIVTLDADFHALLAISGAAGPSAIRIRMQRLKAPGAADVISTVLERIGHELDSGNIITRLLLPQFESGGCRYGAKIESWSIPDARHGLHVAADRRS